MSTSPHAANVPPIQQLAGEAIASLLYAARAYLEPSDGREAALADAEIAIDFAADGLRRIGNRLPIEERRVLQNVLTETRLACVKKRSS